MRIFYHIAGAIAIKSIAHSAQNGVRGFFACRPGEQAEKAKTAFENGAYAVTAEENGINVVCRQRDEFERAAAALTAEEK